IFIVFGMVNIALINFRRNNKDSRDEKPYFFIPMNIKNIPIPTIVALLSLLILLGFNIYNLLKGKL
uniref:hypothetical protein n=1 Tax=Salegentibacter sp. TaxID=1903072 RepID=UPI0035681A48